MRSKSIYVKNLFYKIFFNQHVHLRVYLAYLLFITIAFSILFTSTKQRYRVLLIARVRNKVLFSLVKYLPLIQTHFI